MRCRGNACEPSDSAQERIAHVARVTGFSFRSLGCPASQTGDGASTACRFLWPCLIGELLQDSKLSEGEHVRDHRSNSIAVSFLVAHIFTLVRGVPWIDPGAGDACRQCDPPGSSAGSRSRASPRGRGAQHRNSVDGAKGRKLEDHRGRQANDTCFLRTRSTG